MYICVRTSRLIFENVTASNKNFHFENKTEMSTEEILSNPDKLFDILSLFRQRMKPEDFNKTLVKALQKSMAEQDENEDQKMNRKRCLEPSDSESNGEDEDHEDSDERGSDSDDDSKCIILKNQK